MKWQPKNSVLKLLNRDRPRPKIIGTYETELYGQRVTVTRYETVLPSKERDTIPAIPSSYSDLFSFITGGKRDKTSGQS